MDFALTDAQRQIQSTALSLSGSAPSGSPFATLRDTGLLTLALQRLPAGTLDLFLAIETLAQSNSTLAVALLAKALAGETPLIDGDEASRLWLNALATGNTAPDDGLSTDPATAPAIGAFAVGLADGAFEAALTWARSMRRDTLELEVLQAALADLRVGVDSAQLVVYQAAVLLDRHGTASNAAHLLAARSFALDAALRVTTSALDLVASTDASISAALEARQQQVRRLRDFCGPTRETNAAIVRDLPASLPQA